MRQILIPIFLACLWISDAYKPPREFTYANKVFMHPFDTKNEIKASFTKTQRICGSYGGTLAVLGSVQEQNKVLHWMMKLLGKKDLMIRLGGRRDSENEPWIWDDGSEGTILEEKWHPGSPQSGSVCIIVNTRDFLLEATEKACTKDYLVLCERKLS